MRHILYASIVMSFVYVKSNIIHTVYVLCKIHTNPNKKH